MGIREDIKQLEKDTNQSYEFNSKDETHSLEINSEEDPQYEKYSYEFQYYSDSPNCDEPNGLMSNIEKDGDIKIDKWSSCSLNDFKYFVHMNGGDKFCLYMRNAVKGNINWQF